MRTIDKVITAFIVLVFLGFMVSHGAIDFSGVDFVANKTKEAVQSDEGQEVISEVKDIAYDTAMGLTGNIKERVPQATSDIVQTAIDIKTSGTAKKSANAELVGVRLIRVVDGDTIIVDIGNGEDSRVRFIGIDTPESVNPDDTKNTSYGTIASSYTKQLFDSVDTVWLQFDEEATDQYGRFLAYVWLKDDVDTSNKQDIANFMANGILVSDGYAIDKVYLPNAKYADVFAELRQGAQSQKRGLWDQKSIETIWGN